MTPFGRGHVSRVGAGPGDPDLLTIAAVQAASADRTAAARRSTARGRRRRRRSSSDRCGRSPNRGLAVVRLKGGDPYVFGRGGEERAYLLAAGIDVRLVPGITSGLAAPAAIGILITHRDWSQGIVRPVAAIAFQSGSAAMASAPSVSSARRRWPALAAGAGATNATTTMTTTMTTATAAG